MSLIIIITEEKNFIIAKTQSRIDIYGRRTGLE